MIRKIAKILAYILTTVIGLLIILLLLVHKGSFNAYITRVITEQGSKSIRGEITVESLTGSLFKEFTLHDVKLINDDTVLINAHDIHISYSLSGLIRKRLLIDTLSFSYIDVSAIQYADSTWNILRMFEPAEPSSPEKDTTGDGFFREINISALSIGSLDAEVNSLDTTDNIPGKIDAAFELSFKSEGDLLAMDIQQFSLRTNAPDMNVRELGVHFSIQNKTLQWEELRMQLTETNLISSGILPLDDITGADVKITFSPLAFSDFRPFMTGDTLYGSPDVEINYGGEGPKKPVEVSIIAWSQKIKIDGWLEGIKEQDSYYLQLFVSGLDGSEWTGDSLMKTLVTGTMKIEGTGYDMHANSIDFQGNFDTISYGEYAADTLQVHFNKQADKATGKIELSSNRGELDSDFTISEIFDRLIYDFSSSLRGINIASFIPDTKLSSDLNLSIKAKGSGYDLKTLNTEIIVEVVSSQLAGRTVDQFEAGLSMDNGKYTFKELDLQTPFFRLLADGKGDLYSNIDASFMFEPYDLNPLLTPFGIAETRLEGQMNGTVSGKLDSLNLAAELSFDTIAYDSIKAANFYSNLYVNLLDSTYNGKIDLSSGQLLFGNIQSDSIQLTSEFSNEILDNYLFLQVNDTVQTDLRFIVETGNVPIVHLPKIGASVNESTWTGGSDSTFIALGKDTILIHQLLLNNEAQSIYVNGRLAFAGDESFEIAIRNINLAGLSAFTSAGTGITGALSSDISLLGTARNPEIKGRIWVTEPGYQDLDFNRLQFDMEYDNELLSLKGSLDDKTKQRFYADVGLPLHVSFRDSIALLKEQDGLRAEINIDSLNSKIFNPYFESIGLKSEGYISLQTSITNTLRKPIIEGGFNMKEGSIDYSEKGILYTDIGLNGSFSNERITLEKVKLKAGEGNLEASGYADIAMLGDRKLKNIDMQVAASNFRLIENDDVSALINANIDVKGPYPDIEGKVTMQNGRVEYYNMGVLYEDIMLDGSFSNERITLGNLKIHSGDGSLTASGYADIAMLGDQKLQNLDIQINSTDFKALDSEKGSAVINSDLEIKGPYDQAKVEGQVTILQSTINTDAIMAGQSLNSENPNPPLLVKAMQDTLPVDTTLFIRNTDSADIYENKFYDNLSGEFTIRVPGNTWVKGKDMNFELNGELRAVKESTQIDLFGDLNVNRGYYKFYGKRFSFNRGKVTFTGGEEINPIIDFEVVYSFRDEERELRKLKLFLKGRTKNPDIRFTLDDIFVEEKDAIAYILFGRRMDNLTAQQTASVEQNALNLTRNVALGQISNLLKDALGNTLNLDVVEVSGGESWQSGSVTIGKYITNDLYVSYEQNFAFDKKDKIIEPEQIALEYQIIRSLFLQATNQRENSGFDLIFKKTWK